MTTAAFLATWDRVQRRLAEQTQTRAGPDRNVEWRSLIAARAFSIAVDALGSCRRGCYTAPGGRRRYAIIQPAPCSHCRPTFCLSGPQRSVWSRLPLARGEGRMTGDSQFHP
jgi:hypothetical protein